MIAPPNLADQQPKERKTFINLLKTQNETDKMFRFGCLFYMVIRASKRAANKTVKTNAKLEHSSAFAKKVII